MVWSGVWVSSLARSWRSPLRLMARPFPAVEALMAFANLLLSARAAQQFGFVEYGDAERPGLLQLGPGVRPHYHRGRPLGNVVGDVAAGRLDELLGLGPGQRGEGAGDDVGLPRQRAAALARGGGGIGHREAQLFPPRDQLAVAGVGEESRDGFGDRPADAAGLSEVFCGGLCEAAHGPPESR